LYSLNFNTIDLSAYGLTVQRVDWPMTHALDPVQLQDKSVAYDSHKPPLVINAQIAIEATTTVILRTYIDSIRGALNTDGDAELIFDIMSDRYWLSRFESLKGGLISPYAWQGDISFLCLDPLAYSTSLTTVAPVDVDADPFTLPVTTLGTARISPVYILTANDVLAAVTITLENDETGDTLSWVGSLIATDDLEIDVEHWTVKKTGIIDMATVTGEFPQLLPNQANDIIITGFHSGTHNTIGITYRNRYV
jgi:predicted phage tail component-like protein